jgi:hypothetical protein
MEKNSRKSSLSSDDSSNYSSDYSGGGDQSAYEDEQVDMPLISKEGYYWIGKDYSNTYKADFKDLAKFSEGIFFKNNTFFSE